MTPTADEQQRSLHAFVQSLRVMPETAPRLTRRDPAARPDAIGNKSAAKPLNARIMDDLNQLQYLLFADQRASLLIILQGPDASGKDGTIRKVFTGMDPQGVTVTSFKQPSAEEAAHDFLWRIHKAAPAKGQVAIFNRSHYEDVLIARVRALVPEAVWARRFQRINEFEALLAENGTVILKFFLHLSPEEQLARFRKRLEDPTRQWKISESDYSERKVWDAYQTAYEEAIARTSHAHAPWYVIPADRKWVRNLTVGRIIADRLAQMDLKTPSPRVDLNEIRRRFHEAARQS